MVVIGGGGIGCDVAHKLTEEDSSTIDSYFHRYNVTSYTNAQIQKENRTAKFQSFEDPEKLVPDWERLPLGLYFKN